jgi:post-segregation antitoxin (ccd killing protein)
MAKNALKESPTRVRRGRPKLDKKTVSVRLSEDVMARVRRASLGNLSAYIQLAIENQLKREKIL